MCLSRFGRDHHWSRLAGSDAHGLCWHLPDSHEHCNLGAKGMSCGRQAARGQEGEAIALFQATIALRPDSAVPFNNLGRRPPSPEKKKGVEKENKTRSRVSVRKRCASHSRALALVVHSPSLSLVCRCCARVSVLALSALWRALHRVCIAW